MDSDFSTGLTLIIFLGLCGGKVYKKLTTGPASITGEMHYNGTLMKRVCEIFIGIFAFRGDENWIVRGLFLVSWIFHLIEINF